MSLLRLILAISGPTPPKCSPGITNPFSSVQFSCSTYRKYASFCGAPRSAQELQNLAFTNPTVSSVVQFTANMHTFCGAARSRSRVKYTVFSSQGRRHHANTHRFSSQGRRHHVNTHRFCSQRRRHHVNMHRFCFQKRRHHVNTHRFCFHRRRHHVNRVEG